MANLFDFITGPRPYPVDEKERRRREQLMMPPAPSPTVATPMWNPISLQPTPVDRATGNVGSASTMIAPTPSMRLEDQRRKTRELQDFENNPVVNNDRGWKGRLLDIGRQMLVSAGQAYDKGQGSPTERLLGAAGAGIAGGVYGGFHPEVDEERQRLYDIGRSQQLEGEIEGQIGRDQQRILTDARIQDIPEERRIKELQIESAERAKALAELGKAKYYDPKNPLHVQRVIRAGMDPAQMVAFDDRDPKTIKLGNDVLQLDRATGKWTIAGTRGDLIDWRLPDGRVVSIPADKAAYNATLQQMSAERITSTEKMAAARIQLGQQEFGLAMQKFEHAKKEAEAARARGDEKAAREWLLKMTEMTRQIQSDVDLSPEQMEALQNMTTLLTPLAPIR